MFRMLIASRGQRGRSGYLWILQLPLVPVIINGFRAIFPFTAVELVIWFGLDYHELVMV